MKSGNLRHSGPNRSCQLTDFVCAPSASNRAALPLSGSTHGPVTNPKVKQWRGRAFDRLFRERGKLRQFADVARVVLNDECRLQIRCDLFDALDRSDGLRPIIVENWHTLVIVILAEMDGIAAENRRPHLRQLDQQTGMARRVPGRAQQPGPLSKMLDPDQQRTTGYPGRGAASGQRAQVQ